MTEHTTKKNTLHQIPDQHLNKKSQRNRRVNNPANTNTLKKRNGNKIAKKNETKKATKDIKSHEKKIRFSQQPKSELDEKVQKLKQFYQKIYFRKWVFLFRSKENENAKEIEQEDNHNNENVKADVQIKHHNRRPVKTNKIVQSENCRCPPRKTVDRIRRPLPKFKFSHIQGARREKYDVKLLWPVNNILFPPELDEERKYRQDSPTRKDYLAQVEADDRLSKPKTAATKQNNFENQKLKRKKLTKKGAFELCQRLNLKSSSHDAKNANNQMNNKNDKNTANQMTNDKNETNQVKKNKNETNQGKNNEQEKGKKVKNPQQIKMKNNDNLKKGTKSKQINKTRSKSQNPKQNKAEKKKKQISNENEKVDNEIIEKKDINTSPIRHDISVDSDDSSDIANIINKNRKILNIKSTDGNIKDGQNLDPNDLTELSPDALFDNQNENHDSDSSLSEKINQKNENSDSTENLNANDSNHQKQLKVIIEEEEEGIDSLDEIIGTQNVKNSTKNNKSIDSNQVNSVTTNSNKETNLTSNSNQVNSVTTNSNKETNSNQVSGITQKSSVISKSNSESQNSVTKTSKTEITEVKVQSNNSNTVFNNGKNDIEQNGVRKSTEIKSGINDFDGEEFSTSSVGVADMIGSTDSDVRLINNPVADQSFSSDTDSLL